MSSEESTLTKKFTAFAEMISFATGHPAAFVVALAVIVVWGAMGPFFDFSEIWQIVINTLTTIVTFLLVFVIQNSQNRETRAMQLKLDELIRSHEDADNMMLNLEKLPESELLRLCERYEGLADRARTSLNTHRQRSAQGKTKPSGSQPHPHMA